jgi:hypothetical protein
MAKEPEKAGTSTAEPDRAPILPQSAASPDMEDADDPDFDDLDGKISHTLQHVGIL